MKTSNLSYSVWGIFENKNNLYLKKLKKKLTLDLKGPKFKLHLTLCSGFKIEKKELLYKMDLIKNKSKKFFIQTNNFGCKDNFFQSIFLNVKINNKLKHQRKIIDEYLYPKKQKYFPHISLYYGNLSMKKKKAIIRNLKIFKKRLKIISLYLVINDEKNLKWKVVKKFNI